MIENTTELTRDKAGQAPDSGAEARRIRGAIGGAKAGPKGGRESVRLLALGAWVITLVVASFQPLADLAKLASTDLHSHTLLVPFISGYLIFLERNRLPRMYTSSWFPVLLLAAFGAGLIFAAGGYGGFVSELGNEGPLALRILAFVALAVAGGYACLGSLWMRSAAFPAAFLVFMAPLPDGVVQQLEHWLKLASADAAGWLFQFAGTPLLRDGVVFRLPGIVIQVAQECSGIRSSYVLLITSLVAAHLFLRSPSRRALLVLVVIPLGIVRNGFRIAVLGWLCIEYGPQMIHTWIHHRGGPVFFVLSLIPLFALLYFLWRGERAKDAKAI
jgi:exosortase C (VPDSG-CTERM-specific)